MPVAKRDEAAPIVIPPSRFQPVREKGRPKPGQVLGASVRSDEEIEDALRRCLGVVTDAAKMLGYANTENLRIRIARNAYLRGIVDEYRERLVDLAEQGLAYQVEAGAPWAIAFALKTLGKSRGYVERQELANPDGAYRIVYVDERTPMQDDDEDEDDGIIDLEVTSA